MREAFSIHGSRPLFGEVTIRGSKNAASKMMIASLLTREPCIIENIPFSVEIDVAQELCERIGSIVTREGRWCRIETKEIKNSRIPELSRRNRIPILALGPLLHRTGVAEVPFLGGDPIGHRPIDFHLDALNRMGVRIERREHSYYAEADDIRGAEIEFPFPSVGATEQVILTAVRARGATSIRNAAVEPEICNLIALLRGMGADIQEMPDERRIEIQGVAELGGAQHRVIPDRNEIVSLATAALITGGTIAMRDVHEADIVPFVQKIHESGGACFFNDDQVCFQNNGSFRSVMIETAPHPGFMTDWQQPFCVLLTQAQGTSILHETVYEDRLGYMKDLARMGARIEITDECPEGYACRFKGRTFNHAARISGGTPLKGSVIEVHDIRAGMAHIIAALAAEGESVITGIEHIDRGYERIDERLRELGADVKRLNI